MHQVELMIVGDRRSIIKDFRSTRSAYQHIEDSIESNKNLHMIHSRVHVNKLLSNDWMLVAADADSIKFFLIRLKPTLK